MANESSDSGSRSASVLSKEDSNEGSLNLQQLMFGDAYQYIENEGGGEGLKNLQELAEINVQDDKKRDLDTERNPLEEEKHPQEPSSRLDCKTSGLQIDTAGTK